MPLEPDRILTIEHHVMLRINCPRPRFTKLWSREACVLCVLSRFSHVWLFATPWTVDCQASLSMGFSKENTGVGFHALLQGIILTQELNPCFSCLLLWQAGSLPLASPGKLVMSRSNSSWIGNSTSTTEHKKDNRGEASCIILLPTSSITVIISTAPSGHTYGLVNRGPLWAADKSGKIWFFLTESQLGRCVLSGMGYSCTTAPLVEPWKMIRNIDLPTG